VIAGSRRISTGLESPKTLFHPMIAKAPPARDSAEAIPVLHAATPAVAVAVADGESVQSDEGRASNWTAGPARGS
jgi:hypothetical protein